MTSRAGLSNIRPAGRFTVMYTSQVENRARAKKPKGKISLKNIQHIMTASQFVNLYSCAVTTPSIDKLDVTQVTSNYSIPLFDDNHCTTVTDNNNSDKIFEILKPVSLEDFESISEIFDNPTTSQAQFPGENVSDQANNIIENESTDDPFHASSDGDRSWPPDITRQTLAEMVETTELSGDTPPPQKMWILNKQFRNNHIVARPLRRSDVKRKRLSTSVGANGANVRRTPTWLADNVTTPVSGFGFCRATGGYKTRTLRYVTGLDLGGWHPFVDYFEDIISVSQKYNLLSKVSKGKRWVPAGGNADMLLRTRSELPRKGFFRSIREHESLSMPGAPVVIPPSI
ncbi:unnamed protein product [Acanthoscelides obtectus]|uniref:Uncharacterized protein n=1 Tax=Acanthoscelides obtectus TaxID=200917 RepID=A0A9P0PLT8_ACAOB|nr:unnamed protein product [Acanthoscelides obtectus]CAK1638874.1 hypothetical protein AOBTE_LOCUS10860 [Acanthoscelides obtectus]